MEKTLELYIDDSGSRYPDRKFDQRERLDKMNYFALGGILICAEDKDRYFELYDKLCRDHRITYPLHSTKIRGKRGEFNWLKDEKANAKFLKDLEHFLISIPVIGLAVVIDRGGYRDRYLDQYGENTWWMCKTAATILVERAVKYAKQTSSKLEIYFEESGKKEDRAFESYLKEIRNLGMPFDQKSAVGYSALSPDEFRDTILGDPHRVTKSSQLVQAADLYLYPICKFAYDRHYPPYTVLKRENRLIDCHLNEADVAVMGIKYSCFDKKIRA